MANKTYLDQIIDYPSKVIAKIASDKYCVGLLVNKAFDSVDEDDEDDCLDNYIYSYQYVDGTVSETAAYIWVELEVDSIENNKFKNCRLYVTVSCHKGYMALDTKVFKGVSGNRQDNLVRYLDRLLSGSEELGLGKLLLKSVKTLTTYNNFTGRQLVYEIPDFYLIDGIQ